MPNPDAASAFDVASISLQGNRRINQDRCMIAREGNCVLLLLSDGMGGHPRGEVAAQIVIDTGRAAFDSVSKPISDPLGFLEDTLKTAHEQIVNYGKRRSPPIDPRATAVAALVQNGTSYWIHAGDSRAYLFRGYRVVQRTRDHSFVEQMRGRGLMDRGDPKAARYRNLVTHCLGGAGMRFGITRGRPVALVPHDILLLCSDGLWGQLADDQLGPKMRHHGSLERMANDLAREAEQSAAPSSDNISLIALRWLGAEPSEPAEPTGPTPQPPPAPQADSEQLQDAIELLRAAIDDFESDSN